MNLRGSWCVMPCPHFLSAGTLGHILFPPGKAAEAGQHHLHMRIINATIKSHPVLPQFKCASSTVQPLSGASE